MTEKRYDFHKIIERKNTNSEKWDECDKLFNGNDLIPMWVADMDFASPPEVIDALIKKSEHGIFGYSAYSEKTYESIISWFKRRYNWTLEKDWISFSPGVVTAISFLIQALTDEGDEIIIQSPVYYPFSKLVEGNGRKLLDNNLILHENKYMMNFEDLDKQCSRETVKMIILSSPHNPVGRVWHEDELKEFIKICRKHKVIIISDEIHCDLTLHENKHIPLSSVSDEDDLIITCTSPSKTFNLAGCKTSNIIIKNEEMREKFQQTVLKNGCSDPNPFGIVAMEAAYNHGHDWLEDLKKYLESNLMLMENVVAANLPKINLIKPEATYLAWLDFRNFEINWQEQDEIFINDAKIAPDPGHIFGIDGQGFQRINFACPQSTLIDGMNRIINAFGE